jgi:hypothetical protein
MLLNGKIDDETGTESPDSPTKAWWIGAGVCLFPIYLIFSAFGNPGKGSAAICFGGAMIAVVRLRWGLSLGDHPKAATCGHLKTGHSE